MYTILTGYLSTERLRTFADSVLLVAITILAYNLLPPSVVNGEINEQEVENFLNNIYGLVSSFVVVFMLWVLYMRILDYLVRPDEVIMIISITFFILVLLTPIFTLGVIQYNNLHALVLLALLQIFNGLLLIVLWSYISKNQKLLTTQLKFRENGKMYFSFAVIPFFYLASIAIGFVNVHIATIFPVIIIPVILLLGRYRRE
ncbi:MAG TPA: TMEM175 family protein [Nitrososphaeraceae archaeon]|nr:TMEM175 family protein [Nitrososphaeraceae archaeon]